MSRREKARLDEDKTAKPKTEIVGVYDNPDRNPQRRDRNIYLGHAQEYVVRDTAEVPFASAFYEVCVYCGQAEGHSPRCSVTKFSVPEEKMVVEDRPNEGPSDDDRVSVWMTNYDGCHDRKALKDLIADVRRQERDRDRESPQPKGAINEIVAWLEGLEHTRAQAERIASDPEEKAAMRARRGIYKGIAQDIKHKWGSPSSSPAKPEGSP